MDRGFFRTVDRVQFFGLMFAVIVVPLVFFIGPQNIILFNILRLFFPRELLMQGNQKIVILKPLLAQLVMYVLFAFWLMEALEEGDFELVPDPLNGLLVLWLGWLVITTFFVSYFWYYSVEELGRFLAVFLLYFLVQKVIKNRQRLKIMLWVLFAVCAWTLVPGFFQSLKMPLYEWGRSEIPVVSTFGNKNFFAGFLLTTLPVIAGYILATKNWMLRGLFAALAAGHVCLLLATETRTALLGLNVAGVTFLVLTVIFIRGKQRIKLSGEKIIIMLLICLVFLGVAYLFIPQELVDDTLSLVDLQHGTQRVRWIMWAGASRAALDRPFTGHGHGTFQLVFPNYRPPFYHRFGVSHNTLHSHNEYLEVLMETGLVGLTLFLGTMVVFFLVIYRFLRRSESSFSGWLVIGMASAVAGVLAQNIASVNLRWMSSTFTFWLVVALASAAMRVASKTGKSGPQKIETAQPVKNRFFPEFSWKIIVHFIILVIVAVVASGFYRMMLADLKSKQSGARAGKARQGGFPAGWSLDGEAARVHSIFSLKGYPQTGYAYLTAARYKKIIERYDYLNRLPSNYAQIHNEIGHIHDNLNNRYRSLLHFEWATRLEDNLDNHLNLAGRYRGAGFKDRELYHSLYILRLGLENYLNYKHLQHLFLEKKDFESAGIYSKKREKEKKLIISNIRILEARWNYEKTRIVRLMTEYCNLRE
ncbi:MAG: O-antigen ligase family protein [bacterium]